MRHYKTLTWNDRIRIEAWLLVGISPRVMAESLHVHISTIYRELKRGQYEHLNSDYTTEMRYSPEISEKKKQDYLRAKGAPLKIGNDHQLAAYLEYKIAAEKYSPGAALGEICAKKIPFQTTISEPTLYRYIEDGVFLTLTNKDLPVKRNRNTHKYNRVRRAKRPPAGNSIEIRPAEVNNRDTFGHWEMDCVDGKKGTKKTLLVLTERLTRGEIIRLMKDKTAQSVRCALDGIERKFGKARFASAFKSITVDNGSEFSDCSGLEQSRYGGKRTTVYYCHPYSAWERASNENQNKMVRRWYPKGFDFSNVTPTDVQKLENWINHYPRKLFAYHSSADLYGAYAKKLAYSQFV